MGHDDLPGHLGIQAKLVVGDADDPMEREADAMADKVMRMPEQNFIKRKCSHCQEEERIQRTPLTSFVHRRCSHCEEEEKLQQKPIASFIQRKESGAATITSQTINRQIQSSKGGGSVIDATTKSFMENRFNADFSQVRIHTGNKSIQMSRDLNAKAFTVGYDIHFNEGQYQPGSDSGHHLLAHELTHTIQQQGAGDKISMARFNVGSLNVNVEYGDIIYHDKTQEYVQQIESRFSAWTGTPTAAIHDFITPLTDKERRWLFFAIDVLVDNSHISEAGRLETFLRLIGYLPVMLFNPGSASTDFEFEVLLASGWLSAIPSTAFDLRQKKIARLIQLRSRLRLSQQQFVDTVIGEIQHKEAQDFLTRAKQDAATHAPGHIVENHALPFIQRVIRIEKSGETIKLNANFELCYEGTTEDEGKAKSDADIPRMRQAILDGWTVRFTTGPYVNLTFILNPLISFRHHANPAKTNAWQIMVRKEEKGPSSGIYWLGEISLTPVHLHPDRIRVLAHEVYHLFGPFDAYLSPVEGYTGPQNLAVGRSDPKGRPDLLGLTDPVVLERWRKSGYITAEQVRQQTHIIPAIWEEEATRILQDLNVAPPRRTADEREIEAEIGTQNAGGYRREQMQDQIDRSQQAIRRAEDSIQWVQEAEEAIALERELGVSR